FPRGDFGRVFRSFADVVQNGSLQSTEAEVEGVAARFGRAELDRGWRVACDGCQSVENRTAGITQAEEFGDFVVRLACGVVACLADLAVQEFTALVIGEDGLLLHFVKHGVSAGDDEANGGENGDAICLGRFEENRVDMPGQMVHGYEWPSQSSCERFS